MKGQTRMAVAAGVVNQRALRNEASWLPQTMDDVLLIQKAIREAGHPSQVVYGISGWLVTKAAGREDGANPVTRTRYRKILASLESPLSANVTGDIPGYVNDVPAAA